MKNPILPQASTLITEIEIIPVKPREGLIAFANFVLDQKLFLSSIAVFTKLDGSGYRLVFPAKNVGNHQIQIFHPITKELSHAIENAIFLKIKQVLGGSY